jgi:predicted RNase H-like nuclease
VAVAGIDGARGGWVVARDDGRVEVVPTLDDVVADVRAGALDAVAVDMPIGLPGAPGERRACDVAARRLLGPRRSTVFPAPPRCFLGATAFADVRRLSIQAFHLLPRIAELDALLDPSVQDRLVEAHPELAFARVAGAPLTDAKRTPAGGARRAALVGRSPADVPRLPGARPDDVLDALALVRTAQRVAAGSDERLGDGSVDARGFRMQIAW